MILTIATTGKDANNDKDIDDDDDDDFDAAGAAADDDLRLQSLTSTIMTMMILMTTLVRPLPPEQQLDISCGVSAAESRHRGATGPHPHT